MKKLRLWAFTFLLASTLFIAIEGYADSNRPSINTNGMVRLVYFLPSDRPARPDRVTALRQLIKDAQQFYAEQMHRHGFGRKTFTVETDADGEPLVHQVNGKFKEDHYYQTLSLWKVWAELPEHFEGDDFQHVYFIAIDFSDEGLDGGEVGGLASLVFLPSGGGGRFNLRGPEKTQGEEVFGGLALIPSFGHNFDPLFLTAHELGHGFGLVHDFRQGRHSNYVMGFGSQNRLSKCAAEWLSVSRFFNTKSIFRNEPGEIQLLSLRTYSEDIISLHFKVTDADGLHQAQLLVPDILEGTGEGAYRLFDCKRLNGKTSTVESVVRTAELVDRITLQIIDVGGNITWATFPIQLDETVPAQNVLDVNSDGVVNISDLASLASRFGQNGKDPADVNEDGVVDIVDVLLVAAGSSSMPQQAIEMFTPADVQKWLTLAKQLEVENELLKKGIVGLEHLFAVLTEVTVNIPNLNLRTVIETALGVASGAPIVSSEMETLTHLTARNANISDLTGIEFATHLKVLSLDSEEIAPGTWRNSNSVSDLSPLAGLTRLEVLYLWGNSVSDISPLAGLTNLKHLGLDGNNISDVSVLAGLTNLESLFIDGNPISDISVLAKLTNLTRLGLDSTTISDLSPLAGVTNLTWMRLNNNNISDLSPLVANTGLGNGDEVYVRGNPLSYLSIHTHIPALQSRGVTVESDNQTHPALLKISGDNQKGASFVSLPQPFVIEAQEANGSALVGISVMFAITRGGGTLSITNTRTDDNGRVQSTLILGPNLGANTVQVSATGIESPATFYAISDSELPPITADVNNDGSVNVLDLILIASELGNVGTNLTMDVNGDRVVSILDLILVAGMFDEMAAAPSAQPQVLETLTAVEVQGWLTDARALEVRDPIMKRGFTLLEQLLAALTPRETVLLANYPNPFNPETWIPYRLAEDTFVTLTIYDLSGRVVHTLDVGHRIASAYENRSKTIYWDGKNGLGEQVASGVYFYTLTAGDFSATRKMLILK